MYILDAGSGFDSEKIKTIIELVALLSVIITGLTYYMNRRRNFFDAVKACHERYRQIVEKQQMLEMEEEEDNKKQLPKTSADYRRQHLILFRDHLGLICEEIFYIREGILPKTIAYSWLAEMAGRIPFYEKDGNEIIIKNKELLKEGENKWLYRNALTRMQETFKHFKGLHNLFQLEEGIAGFSFSTEYSEWKNERRRFAFYLYKKIRGSRGERFINRFRQTWKYGRW